MSSAGGSHRDRGDTYMEGRCMRHPRQPAGSVSFVVARASCPCEVMARMAMPLPSDSTTNPDPSVTYRLRFGYRHCFVVARASCPCLEFLHFRSKGTKASGPGVVPLIVGRSGEFVPVAPLGLKAAWLFGVCHARSHCWPPVRSRYRVAVSFPGSWHLAPDPYGCVYFTQIGLDHARLRSIWLTRT
jgi:hypothetical protein